jgi:hypothetical protein
MHHLTMQHVSRLLCEGDTLTADLLLEFRSPVMFCVLYNNSKIAICLLFMLSLKTAAAGITNQHSVVFFIHPLSESMLILGGFR